MAIIVEEEKNRSNLASMLGWLVILAAIGAAVYYLFFVIPPPALIKPPAGFQNITPITSINFDPESILGSPSFQSLKAYIAEPASSSPAAVGRQDPFLAP